MSHALSVPEASSHVQELIELSQSLGHQSRDWAAVSEGNASRRVGPDGMVVKASGSRLRTATARDVVQLRISPLLELLEGSEVDDRAVDAAFEASSVSPVTARPSVEALLHAVCLADTDADFVAHTHPTDVNAVLCSQYPELLISGDLFPDQIVVLGRHRMLVPYVDPGLRLARRVRADLDQFKHRHGSAPRVIYLANHGLFALGSSAQEVIDITDMATKCARVLLGSLRAGGAQFLSAVDAERIDTRVDERRRRAALGNPPAPPQPTASEKGLP